MADESAETSRLSDELNSDINHNKPANPSYNRGNSADSATNNNKLTVSQVSYSRSDSNHQPPPQIMANGSLIDLDDDDSELEHELQAAGLVEPPDGGYGWIIMMASFMTNCVVDGVVFTAGQGFAQEWERYYGASGTEASLVVSLLSGCYMLAGPIVSALANLFGCRRVAFAGATLAVAGFLLSLIAPNIYVLYFTFGIMGGTGFGMVYLPSIVIVSYYFTSKRALATGIAVCGSGIGMFLFAPIIAYLQEEFNWQQTLLIMTGISCHLFICAALFRPLEPTETQIDKVAEIAMVHEQNRVMSIRSLNKTSLQYSDDVNVVTETETNGAVDMIANLLTTQESKMMPTSNLSTADLFHAASKDAVNVLNRPLSRMDIFYTGSMTSLALRQPPSKPGRRPSLIMLSQASLETFDEQGESSWKDAIIAGIHTMIDISLFKSPVFLVLGSGGFLTMCGFFVPFIFLGRVAQAAGHSSDLSSYLISVLGIVNIFARIFCGWLSDRPQLDSLVIHNTAICLGGLATMAVPFFTGYWMFLVYCVVFGFCTGFLADVTGSYDVSFYVMGFILFLSGLIGFPLRRIAAWERKKMGLEDEEEDEEEEEDNDSEMEPEQKEMYGRAPARSNNNDEEATNRVKERLANLSGEE